MHENPCIFCFPTFCIINPHESWNYTSTQGAILEENGSHKNLECIACMNLDDFHVQVHLGLLLGLHRPTPAPFTHFWIIWQSLSITEKGGHKLGQPHGRPTSLVGRPWGGAPLFNSVHRELMALLLMQIWSTHKCARMRISQLIFTSEASRRPVRPDAPTGQTGWSRDAAKT